LRQGLSILGLLPRALPDLPPPQAQTAMSIAQVSISG
jgi:hypothetical protein